MKENQIITIGRQFGSGGRQVGQQLAEKLGIPCYDKEVLARAAEHSGLSEKIIKNYDEKPRSIFFSSASDSYTFGVVGAGADDTIENRAMKATMQALWHIEEEGSCIIIGRAADYFLKHQENLIRVFIYAPMEFRIAEVSRRDGIPEDKARRRILQADKKRAAYYNFYTMKQWGDLQSYDICINSAMRGVEGTADILWRLVEGDC